MSNNQRPERSIGILKWDNTVGEYIPQTLLTSNSQTGQLKVTPTGIRIANRGLGTNPGDRTSEKSLPIGLKFMLGGIFANKVLKAKNPEWGKLSEFDKLWEIGSRKVGCYQVMVDRPIGHSNTPVVGRQELDELLGDVAIATSKGDLRRLLTDKNFYSLTATSGSTPKVEYQDEEGYRWIVKQGAGDLTNKLEHALTSMQKAAGIQSSETHYEKIADRGHLLCKRYDLNGPVFQQGNPVASHKIVLDQLTVKALFDIDRANGLIREERYADVIETIAPYYEDRQVLAEDLYRRAVFAALTNDNDYSISSLSLLENRSGHGYSLAPARAVHLGMGRNIAQLPIVPQYQNSEWIDYSDHYVSAVSEEFGITKERVRSITHRVASVLDNIETHAQLAGLSGAETQLLREYVAPEEKIKMALRNTAIELSDESKTALRRIEQSSPNMSMS